MLLHMVHTCPVFSADPNHTLPTTICQEVHTYVTLFLPGFSTTRFDLPFSSPYHEVRAPHFPEPVCKAYGHFQSTVMVTSRRAALWLLVLLLSTFSILSNEFQIGNLFRNEFQIGNNLPQHENNETEDYLLVKIPRRKINFLHVGKAGGSTIGETLKVRCSNSRLGLPKRKMCAKGMERIFSAMGGESALSKHVIGYSHVTVGPDKATWNESNAFLFSVRNPINRWISWYNYNFNSNHDETARGIFQCFPKGIESLAQSLTVAPLYPEQRPCWKRAWEIFSMTKSIPGWMWHVNPYNYQYYAKQSIQRYTEHEVFAIRTEHLWKDYRDIDVLLGGKNGTNSHHGNKVANKGTGKFTSLSQKSRTNLCCALINEMVVYEEILWRAVNIDNAAYFESMNNLLNDCGRRTMSNTTSWWTNSTDGSYLHVWAKQAGCG